MIFSEENSQPRVRRLLAQSPLWFTVLVICLISSGCKGPWFGGGQTTQPAVVQVTDSPFRPTSEPADPTAEENDDPSDDESNAASARPGEAPIRRVSVRLNVLRVTGPAGSFTKNSAIWKTVVGALADAGAASCLR